MLTPEELKLEAWTWSFSKFKRWQECGEKYRQEYLEKQKLPPLSQKPFFQGSVAHKTVEQTRERVLKGELDSLRKAFEVLPSVFDSYAAGVDWKDDSELITARMESEAILTSYLDLIEQQELDRGEVYCEHWFGTHESPLVRPSGLRLVGAIDWLKIDRSSNMASIFDAKTSASMKYLDRRQLTMYAMAVEQQFNVDVEQVGFLMLRWQKPVFYTVSRRAIAALEQELVEASQQVEAGQGITARPAMDLCATCQYSTRCGPYRHWIVNSNLTGEVEW